MWDIDYPKTIIQWYLTTGMLRRDPVFHKWLHAQQPLQWIDVLGQAPHQFELEYINKIEKYGLQYTIMGGVSDGDSTTIFSLAMASDKECRIYSNAFAELLPFLCLAQKVSCGRSYLTEQKKTILRLISLGQSHKQVADKLCISERTVKMHLEGIRKRLYAENATNAVAIALRTGLIE